MRSRKIKAGSFRGIFTNYRPVIFLRPGINRGFVPAAKPILNRPLHWSKAVLPSFIIVNHGCDAIWVSVFKTERRKP